MGGAGEAGEAGEAGLWADRLGRTFNGESFVSGSVQIVALQRNLENFAVDRRSLKKCLSEFVCFFLKQKTLRLVEVTDLHREPLTVSPSKRLFHVGQAIRHGDN